MMIGEMIAGGPMIGLRLGSVLESDAEAEATGRHTQSTTGPDPHPPWDDDEGGGRKQVMK